MATREEIERALRNAHAAGDTAAATQLARAYREATSQPREPRFIEQRAQNTEEQRQQYALQEGERLRQERQERGEFGQRFITPEERRARVGRPALTNEQAFRENIAAAGGVGSGLVSGALGLPADLVTLGGNILTLGAMGNPLEPITSAGIQESINQQLPEYLTDTRSFDPMSQFGQVFAPGVAVAKTVDIAAPVVSRVTSNLYRGKGRNLAEGLRRSALEDIETQSERVSRRLRTAKVLRARQAEESEPVYYSTRTGTDVGSSIQEASRSNLENLRTQRKQADDALREIRDRIAQQNEAQGVFIEQKPAYQKIIERTRPYVDPNVYESSNVRTVVPEIRNLYKRLHDAVTTKRFELTPDEAVAARNAGATDVQEINGKFYRTFRTSFNAIDELRRFYGQAFSSNVEGFKAIPKNVRKDFYELLDDLQEQYVGSAQTELQSSWKQYTNQINDLDTRIGRRVASEDTLGMNVYQEIGKGSENIDRLIEQTGNPEIVQRAALDFFLNKIQTGSLKDAEEILQPGNILFETLNNPNLSRIKPAVVDAINQLRTRTERAATSGKIATSIESQAAKSDLGQLKVEIENLPIDEVLTKVEDYYKKYYPGESEEYAKIVREVASAKNAMEARRRIIRNLLTISGAGALGSLGYNYIIGD